MEAACGILRANVFYGGAVRGCKAAERSDLKPKLKYERFHCIALGDSRLKRNAYSLMNLKKSTTYSSFRSDKPRILNAHNLWASHCSFDACSVYDGHVKTSKRLGLSQCSKNKPVADPSEDGKINNTDLYSITDLLTVLPLLALALFVIPKDTSIFFVWMQKLFREIGIIILLFNTGLKFSLERRNSLVKYVFGLGSAQVLATAVAVGLLCHKVVGLPGPAAFVIGSGLALSSTAAVLQVLQGRGEDKSFHGRATSSVLLFQDLAGIVLLMLIPLISPASSNGGVDFWAIVKALSLAGMKAGVAICAIAGAGRMLLHPIYEQIIKTQDKTTFTVTTLVILVTIFFTQRVSMGLGAFIAGLLLSSQIASEIGAYNDGQLRGFFFMVGVSIGPIWLVSNFTVITRLVVLLIAVKATLAALIGRLFGLPIVSAIRVGLLLAPGGEFAFLAFGEAVKQGLISSELSSLLFVVVCISMAITPYLAYGGQFIASQFELLHIRNPLPVESETKYSAEELTHIIEEYGDASLSKVIEVDHSKLKEDELPLVRTSKPLGLPCSKNKPVADLESGFCGSQEEGTELYQYLAYLALGHFVLSMSMSKAHQRGKLPLNRINCKPLW